MRVKKYRYLLGFLPLLFGVFFLSARVEAGTIYNSPYVEFAPDAKAWTTNLKDADYEWYPKGKTVTTGIESNLQKLEKGQHYFKQLRYGTIPIKQWKVAHRTGACVHNAYPTKGISWHGIDFGRRHCGNYYYSGWNPYCADCGERITPMLFYMSQSAAETLNYLEVGTGMDYYYLCPWCDNLEMGSPIEPHACSSISWNRYKVRYDANTIGLYGGYMEDSIHFYNNTTIYEGEEVSPQKGLSCNAYSRKGYVFAGWNTMPDGSGVFYEDGAEIYNLTSENYEPGTEAGIITLYAMWQPSSGTLCIDPAGGSYDGKESECIITGEYLEKYTLKEPVAPLGNSVRFDTSGGLELEEIVGGQRFVEWIQSEDFEGHLERNGSKGDVYFFTVPDGHKDKLTACYEKKPIQLPLPQREGYSFGGWFYDKTFQKPAGDAGDQLVPDEDIVLYAQWVELKLTAINNYTDNAGKGAVDLKWEQPDGREKHYLVYQSRDAEKWKLVTGAEEIGVVSPLNLSVPYTGRQVEYQVPYSGFYQISLLGAQGENYASYKGGAGGKVFVKCWLEKGENLTFTVGGQSGYACGGIGSTYGNGGGYTSVYSDHKGLFLIAGGGGGASESGDGGAGGSSVNLTTGMTGENGMSGGGAGNRGGKAGEYIRHYHTQECYREMTTDLVTEYNHCKEISQVVYDVGEDEDGDETEYIYQVTQYGNIGNTIPVKVGDKLQLEVLQSMIYPLGDNDENNSFLEVYNQKGECIFRKYGGEHSEYYTYRTESYGWEDGEYVTTGIRWKSGKMGEEFPTYWWRYAGEEDDYLLLETSGNIPSNIDPEGDRGIIARWLGGSTHYRKGTSFFGTCGTYFIEELMIPEGTTGIYFRSNVDSNYDAHGIRQNIFRIANLSGVEQICGYEEGEIISSKPAYGGSNYVNGTYCTNVVSQSGINIGNGSISMVSGQIGFCTGNTIKGVAADDLEAPDAIEEATVQRMLKGSNQVQVQWQKPKDNGTEYFHKVESYQENVTCCSNITSNVLTTGIAGYYWLRDGDSQTCVTTSSEYFCKEEELILALEDERIWLHIAPVDQAGNLGETIHVNLNPFDWKAKWMLHTKPLQIELSEYVYPSDDEDVYYVRCDGETPFTMNYGAWMEGRLYDDYRLNQAIFETTDETVGKTEADVVKNSIRLDGEDEFFYSVDQESALLFGTYTEVHRQQEERYLQLAQQFVLKEDADGKTLQVIPRAAADSSREVTYSDYDEDIGNGVFLLGDGEAPLIQGLEQVEQLQWIDRRKESILLEVKAEDVLSGVAEFYIEIENHDNRITKRIMSDETATIFLSLTEKDPVFSGDFSIKAIAKDHVGNVREENYDTMGFSLEAKITRILSPHEPVFRKGESGILNITVWGYPDRVEVIFPQEMTQGDTEWKQIFDYTDMPMYIREETLQFMVPLEMEDTQESEVIVRAYKGERKLEEHPALAILSIEGSILEDIRTRLR
ncbi:MAG: InlB B-repeat-containing protein [Lachnospiraceae bacterium]|nr:InlB B-repeat-containing protein [Lachnospiraceae bacterium]